MSSINVFLRFVQRDEKGNIDASRVISEACFAEWLSSKRENVPRDPEEAFRKSLIGHCILSLIIVSRVIILLLGKGGV